MQNKIDSIQALRAVAAVAVVVAHSKLHLVGFQEKYDLPIAWLNIYDPFGTGKCGVDIFFVISGFIMALVTRDIHKKQGSIQDFIQKRLIRILPPYWLWTIILLFLLFFFPRLFSIRTFELDEAILSFFLIPYLTNGANFSPVLPVGWTLTYEMYFYGLVCIGLLFSRKTFIVGLGIFFLVSTVLFPQNYGPISHVTSNTILWEFYAGILLYELYRKGINIPVFISTCMGVLSLVAFYIFAENALTSFRFIYWGIPAFMLVASCIFLEKTLEIKIPKLIIFLGDSSYSLYLSHLIVIPGIAKLFVLLGLHNVLSPDLQIITYTVLAVFIAGLIYIFTEKPMLLFFRAISK